MHQTITNSQLHNHDRATGNIASQKRKRTDIQSLKYSAITNQNHNVSLDTSSWSNQHVWERPSETGMLWQVSYVHHTTLPVKLQIKDLQSRMPSVPGMWFKERPSMPLQREFITKGGQYCKCHVFYSMLVHGPVSGYNSLQRSGETGGLWGDMLRYFCPPASLTTHDNQYSHTTHFLPAKNTLRGTLETAFADCSIYAAGTKSQILSGSVSRVLSCCLDKQLPSKAVS